MASAPAREGSTGVRAPGMPHVSVCIVNWNCRDLLRGCLCSLRPRRQRLRLQVIVVDNASTDGAGDMVAREFPEVTLIRNAVNVGFARANNQAAGLARAPWLFFLNNDTVVPRGELRRLIRFARAHPEAGLIGPLLRDGKGSPQISFRARPTVTALLHRTCLLRWTGLFRQAYRVYRSRGQDFTSTRPVEVLMGAALLMRRKDFREAGRWDESFVFGGEDIDLCMRVAKSKTVLYCPSLEITHFAGVSRTALACFKLIKTLDTPLQAACHCIEYVWRRARGKPSASRSLLCLRADLAFLKKVPEFWRA
jgi:N-acetylglucosaminyl-diphospho-decaprenol L-rhamnosyltransferase